MGPEMNGFHIREIAQCDALSLVRQYHYSDTLPKINKHFLGCFDGSRLVGVVTLGYGTRPRHTIQKLFPSLDTCDYYEIGRMCMLDEMPRNSESQMLSKVCHWLRGHDRGIKVLFTWADGIMGKPGYVYQASSFLYAGYIETDIYSMGGVKLHPRAMKSILLEDPTKDSRITVRPSTEQMLHYGIDHYRGRQFRYLTFTCNKPEKRRLQAECTVKLTRNYPKADALMWRKKNLDNGKWERCEQPRILTDAHKQEPVTQLSLF